MQNKPLLILDLDETLIFGTETKLERQPDFQVFNYYIYKRPFVDLFISEVFKYYDVAVWSSATSDYVNAICNNIFPNASELKFIWGRDKCTRTYNYENMGERETEYVYVKNLKKIKKKEYDINRVLIIDDSPEKAQKNYGNLIRVSPFEGRLDDKQLSDILPFLKDLSQLENIREVEKRGWNLKYNGE